MFVQNGATMHKQAMARQINPDSQPNDTQNFESEFKGIVGAKLIRTVWELIRHFPESRSLHCIIQRCPSVKCKTVDSAKRMPDFEHRSITVPSKYVIASEAWLCEQRKRAVKHKADPHRYKHTHAKHCECLVVN
jgi:hypothetical protein